jgi:hypothetical protein
LKKQTEKKLIRKYIKDLNEEVIKNGIGVGEETRKYEI